MKISKRIAVLGAAAVLTAGLAACGGVTKDDATVYVKGQIDSTYLGQYNEDYLKLMDMTEAEAAEDYEWNLGAEADWFMDFASIYPSDETKEKVVELYKEIYAKCKYTVQPASKLDNGNFAVEVLVEPMDLMVQFQNTADLDTVWTEVTASGGITSDEQINAMSDAEYEALEARYADKVIALVRGLLPDVGYETEQSCIIQLKLNDENVYEMVGTDWQNLDGMMIDYYGSYAQ